MVSNNATRNVNIKPILYTVIGFIISTLIYFWFINQGERLNQECANLIKYGKIIHGEIIDIKPYSHSIQRARGTLMLGQSSWFYQGVSVKIICKEFNNKVIYEDWVYESRNGYKVGDGVDLYYLDKNYWIKLASVHEKRVAKVLSSNSLAI